MTPALRAALQNPPGFPVIRPNIPVLPFSSQDNLATFVDPSAKIINGNHVVAGWQSYIAPYVLINATSGFVKIGSGSDVLDNAVILSDPNNDSPPSSVFIGDAVSIGNGALISGPVTIGAYGKAAQPTLIGPNAFINGAIIKPGAAVGALAQVGPGVTVPTGFMVRPGKNVTTDAEASDPALGKVVPLTAAQLGQIGLFIQNNVALANGYATLYQGNKATGISLAVPLSITNVFNGDLSTVEGASAEAGGSVVKFEPTSGTSPKFLGKPGILQPALLAKFPARVIGGVTFNAKVHAVAHTLGRHNSIRGDQGQPLAFASTVQTGSGVSINSPVQGELQVGTGVQIDSGAVILAGPLTNPTDVVSLGNNAQIGSGSVIDRSTIGSGAVIGARSYIADSTIPANTTVAPGSIIINNVFVGTVEW